MKLCDTLAILLACGLSGCVSIDCASIDAMQGSFEVISEEYLDYVESDEDLGPDAKDRRRVHIEEHRALLEDMARQCEVER